MPSPSKLLLAGLASLALAACGTDRQETPLVPTSVSYSATPSCSNFSFIRNDAKAYFSSTKDPVFEAISALESAQGLLDQSVTKNAALTVLSRVAVAAKDASLRKSTATPTVGNTLVQDIFLCSTYTGYPTNLTASLGPDGLFEVLGGASDEPPTTGKYVVSHGTILYGAEPQATNTWAGSASGRFLLYGYLRSTTGFTLESLVPGTSAFELTAFPSVTFNPKIVAGECTPGTSVYPVQHQNSILPNVSLDFCPQTGAMAPQKSPGFFATLVSWITPQPAYAGFSTESAGGLISGLSPFAPVVVDATKIAFTIKQQVNGGALTDFTDKNVGDTFDVVVSLKTTTNGTALADIVVTALISGNSGSFTQPQPITATTNADGVAVFPNWSIDKAGGYTITATAPVLGAGLSASSNLFNVKNKTTTP
jgi:hypothetical protein